MWGSLKTQYSPSYLHLHILEVFQDRNKIIKNNKQCISGKYTESLDLICIMLILNFLIAGEQDTATGRHGIERETDKTYQPKNFKIALI